MILSKSATTPGQPLTRQEIAQALETGLAGRFTKQKVLVLIPDHTRSLPLPLLFRLLVDTLGDARQLDFMVALGTHPPLQETQLNQLVGITPEERNGLSRRVNLLNHAWEDPSALAGIGAMETDEIKTIAGDQWHASLPGRVDIRINKAALECEQILILGPTFPHEVAGFSGGAKYLFPGISGPGMINATHWLGALGGVVRTIGYPDTPVRRMIHTAAQRLQTPVTLAALVMDGHDLAGIFIGDLVSAWRASANLSAERNVIWSEEPYQQVLSCAPAMYDELWTAAKAMYKLEPVVAPGGEVIIYAPHLDIVSRVHEQYIFEVGYHILPYFLGDWERFRHIPLGVLAHSTHLRGSGTMENGMEKPNVRVTLASRISARDCARLNLGYLDPGNVDVTSWKNQEADGVLYVPRAGEKLYRVRT